MEHVEVGRPGRAGLPVEQTRLIGRDREPAEVSAVVDQTRLLTLAGPGGCGMRVSSRLGPRMTA
jgi:hypothetical protein